jgi:hypothetical protein
MSIDTPLDLHGRDFGTHNCRSWPASAAALVGQIQLCRPDDHALRRANTGQVVGQQPRHAAVALVNFVASTPAEALPEPRAMSLDCWVGSRSATRLEMLSRNRVGIDSRSSFCAQQHRRPGCRSFADRSEGGALHVLRELFTIGAWLPPALTPAE